MCAQFPDNVKCRKMLAPFPRLAYGSAQPVPGGNCARCLQPPLFHEGEEIYLPRLRNITLWGHVRVSRCYYVRRYVWLPVKSSTHTLRPRGCCAKFILDLFCSPASLFLRFFYPLRSFLSYSAQLFFPYHPVILCALNSSFLCPFLRDYLHFPHYPYQMYGGDVRDVNHRPRDPALLARSVTWLDLMMMSTCQRICKP
jgi:hypothetical protein